MAKPIVYTFPAAVTTAVANLQTTVGAGNLLLNGTLAVGTATAVPVTIPFGNVSRTVSLTSAANNSGVNVTITGTYQGAVRTETIAGPNANTVFTTTFFDSVTAVSVNGAVTAMSVGTGTTGQSFWYLYNYHATVASFSVQVEVTGTINYSFQSTLDNVELDATPFINEGIILPNSTTAGVNTNTWITVMSDATASSFAHFSYPVRYANILINSSAGGSLVATFLQQGIT